VAGGSATVRNARLDGSPFASAAIAFALVGAVPRPCYLACLPIGSVNLSLSNDVLIRTLLRTSRDFCCESAIRHPEK